jgi:thiamine biosynthesis lipoprotein
MSPQFTFTALGTKWWIELFDELSPERRTIILDDCTAFVHQFESNYSRFKPTSYISQLNQNHTLDNPSLELQSLLTYGKKMYLRTNTHFNILTGHIQEANGYDADYSFVVNNNTPATYNPIVDLSITAEVVTIADDSKVDIGGFGKGYVIDLLRQRLQEEHGLKYFLINGGGDLYVTSNHDKAINIHMEHPTKAKLSLGTLTLKDQAFASSSPYKRTWKSGEGTQTHIIGETRLASYIMSESAADADVFATAALLMSQPELEQLAKSESFQFNIFNPDNNMMTSNVPK